MQKYLYLPRLRHRPTYEKTLATGAGSRDFFAIANGEHDGKFDGFRFGDPHIQLDDTLLLIEPAAAAAYEAAHRAPVSQPDPTPSVTPSSPDPIKGDGVSEEPGGMPPAHPTASPTPADPPKKFFSGAADINPATVKMKLQELAEEIILVLASDPTATLKVSVEIDAEFPGGASDPIRRAVSENAKQLRLKRAEWS